MALGVVEWDRGTEHIAGRDDRADLQLIVESPGWANGGRSFRGLSSLTDGSSHAGSADDDRRRSPMIADRNPLVIRQQRIVGTKHAANVGRMRDRRIKIGVVANARRERQLSVAHGNENALGD